MCQKVYLLQPIVFSIPLCSLRRQLHFKHFLLFFYTAHPPQKMKSIAIPSAPLKKGNGSGEWSLLVKFPYGFISRALFYPRRANGFQHGKNHIVKGIAALRCCAPLDNRFCCVIRNPATGNKQYLQSVGVWGNAPMGLSYFRKGACQAPAIR